MASKWHSLPAVSLSYLQGLSPCHRSNQRVTILSKMASCPGHRLAKMIRNIISVTSEVNIDTSPRKFMDRCGRSENKEQQELARNEIY